MLKQYAAYGAYGFLQDYVEKTIKISQKANKDKGFGFTLSGGADKKQPVVVEKVALGKKL